MLVLTRKSTESIMIGSNIVVTVLEVRGDQVRIGIDAPRSVAVHREEVYRQVATENTAAVQSTDAAKRLLTTKVPPKTNAAPRPHPGAARSAPPAAD